MKLSKARLICILLFIVAISGFALASTEHVYINGKIAKFSKESINIDDKDYRIAHNVKIVKHVRKGGSIYEEPANFNELAIGKKASIKVLGGVVYEIIIEAY